MSINEKDTYSEKIYVCFGVIKLHSDSYAAIKKYSLNETAFRRYSIF